MYNRYIPQPDGSYKKKQLAEPRRQGPVGHSPPHRNTKPPSAPPPHPPTCPPAHSEEQPQSHCSRPSAGGHDSLTGFFKQLLPKDLDTADLLIILLLLLMAGDCEESKNNALLTLALYFLM